MARELYSSVVSKIAIRVPMFAKAIVDKALARVGANPYTVTPSQMKRAIEEQITPMLGKFLKPAERVKHLGTGLLTVDGEDRLLQASPAALGMLELRGRGITSEEVVRRSRELGVIESAREIAAHREDVLVREVKLPGGRTCNVAMALMRDREGRMLGVTSILQDVTLAVQLEHEVDRLFTEQERANRSLERSREKLQFYVAELEEATRLKSRLLANVSHELRTPLNAIIGFTDTVLAGIDGPLLDPQRESLAWVSKSAKHLLALINDLLDLSRIEAGKLAVVREKVDVTELVGAVTSTLAVIAREKGLDLISHVGPGVESIVTDRTRVRQVLMNLVSNAIKFTPQGNVSLDVTAEKGGDWVAFRVIDTGIGIPPHEQHNIWKEFHQVGAAPGGFHAGTGLGLSISRRYAELLGGSLEVESVVGQGSTFTLRLPREGRTRSGSFRPVEEWEA